MAETVKIATTGASTLPLTEFVHFQGNLKSLAEEDYLRLKKDILELGFSEPVSVWRSKGKHHILNGHQRIRALRKMAEEGYSVPDVPVNWIEAADVQEAKRKVLSLTSQFGKMEKQGLYEFIHDSGIRPDEMYERYRFSEIDIPRFTEEFFTDRSPTDGLDIGYTEPHYDPENQQHEQAAGDDATQSIQDAGDHGQLQPTSHVRMVQLFCDDTNHDTFRDQCTALQRHFNTDNLTDTVVAAVKYAHEQLVGWQ